MLLRAITAGLAGALLSTATLAAAAENVDTRTTGVEYQDLDLTNPQGRSELERRIDRAAKSVCGMNERSTGSNVIPRESRDCYREAKRQLDRQFAQRMQRENRGG